ncbi:MAG TPA: hypothetical protein VLI39_12910 [Sedimentisphaerales bacterium]|nr:hypothetical protein [Sedimentisphaerales bacterium]
MNKKLTVLSVAVMITLGMCASLAHGGDVEISAVNSAADLDLSGEIIYPINFGNSGNPQFGDLIFSQDEDYPGYVSRTCSGEEPVVPSSYGVNPNTGDSNLDRLLGSVAWTNNGPGACTTYVSLGGLHVGATYKLQLVFYEARLGENRRYDITVAGEKIVTLYDVLAHQDGVIAKGGSVLRYTFKARDTLLRIEIAPVPDNGGWLSSISALILTKVADPLFADYGSGTTTELVSGKGTWQINWGQGPWTWADNAGEPLLGSNVSSVLALHTTAPAKVSADMVATLPVQGDLILTARDKANADVVIGTMSLSGTGVNIVDLNASRVIVDQGSGIGMAPFHAPGPELAMTLNEATGVFAYIRQTADWRLQLAGLYAMPLAGEGITQMHILAALGGKVPLVGGLGVFALSGEYEPVETMKPKSFCEYGTAVATQFGAAGGLWQQIWGGGPWSWRTCPAGANVKLLGENVFGKLETTTSGAPSIDKDMVLRSPFGGQITLTDYDSAAHVEGQLKGDVTGTFVADVNAANATLDSDGNIVCAFGVAVHDAPDAMITVTEATGIYADVRQAGEWGWYVNGTMTIARIPDLPLQQNILAALQKPELLLGAHEEFVLTGWYYHKAP